jgi:hypothetical protein
MAPFRCKKKMPSHRLSCRQYFYRILHTFYLPTYVHFGATLIYYQNETRSFQIAFLRFCIWIRSSISKQWCQMAYFQTKNPNLGKFWKVLQWNLYGYFVYFSAKLYILWPNCIFYGHLVHFVVIGYLFPVLVSCTEKNMATLYPSIKQ